MSSPSVTSARPPATRSRRIRLGLAAVAALACLAVVSACTPEQSQALGVVNGSRSDAGVAGLLPSPHAMDKAQAWAEHLAAIGRLEHSDLRDGMPDGWKQLAENVGYGPSIEAIEQAFLNSPGHRANLLNPVYNWVGTGTARSANGTLFVVQVFAKY
jgi:uncharacterized protein YkwD